MIKSKTTPDALPLPPTREAMRELVDSSEAAFVRDVSDAVASVVEASPKVILLSGPSCSGKTTTSNYLCSALSHAMKHVTLISIDDYFLNRQSAKLTTDVKEDLDSVKAIDLDFLARSVDDLLSGRITWLPRYDFTTGKRSSLTEYKPRENDVYLFEGIQAVYPEVVALFPPSDVSSVFINVNHGVDITDRGVSFSPIEVRLLRRILRDFQFRSASPEYTFFLWESVRENEEKSIIPYSHTFEIDIDSLMPYELFAMAKHLPPLLDTVKNDGKYKEQADVLKEKLARLTPNPIEDGMIPDGSVLREFIGPRFETK